MVKINFKSTQSPPLRTPLPTSYWPTFDFEKGCKPIGENNRFPNWRNWTKFHDELAPNSLITTHLTGEGEGARGGGKKEGGRWWGIGGCKEQFAQSEMKHEMELQKIKSLIAFNFFRVLSFMYCFWRCIGCIKGKGKIPMIVFWQTNIFPELVA